MYVPAYNLYSQNHYYKFDRYTTIDGLSSNTITCITKDNEGFIWIGTIDGLNRFDGNSFKIYHPQSDNPTSISDSWINDICSDNDYLWVGTPNGLNKFDKATEQFKKYRFDPDNNYTISNDFVTVLYHGKKNEIWVGTEDGLNLFDKTTEKIKRYKRDSKDTLATLSHNFIKALYEDKEGYLWIGTHGGGLNRYDKKNNEFKHYRYEQANPFSLSNDFIEGIVEDSTGNLWIATRGGVNKFEKKNEVFYYYKNNPFSNNSIPGNNVKAISKGIDQLLWFGINPEGISIYDPFKNTFTNLLNNLDDVSSVENISKIFYDDKGSTWISSSSGISIYNKNKWKFNHYKNTPNDSNSLINNEVISICDDADGNAWIATKAGLQILDKISGEFIYKINNNIHAKSLVNIQHIFRDKKNYMWISTTGGPLKRYDSKTGSTDNYYDIDGEGFNSRCIFEDKEENLWIGSWSGGGVTVFDKNRNFKKKYLNAKKDFADFSLASIHDISEDSKGNIWIASFEGLIMLDPRTDEIIFYKNIPRNPNTLSDNRVTGIVEDKKGYLWITTYGEGLNKFDPVTKNFKNYIEDWLGADIIVGILADDKGNLWLSNYKGISKFNTENESFINYDIGDGVQGAEFTVGSFYKSEDGEMYFGGTNGFNSFYPDSIRQNSNIPNVAITGFRIFNKEAKLKNSITETKEIVISYKENFFSFYFAALDYTNPKKNQYAYKLEEIDKDWNYSGNVSTANYTDISPGEYLFRVKASNNDGVWNEEGTYIKLTIIPPWYKTLWFNGFIAVCLIGGIVFILNKRTKTINKEKKRQEEFTKELLKSQESDRKRVAGELHDSLAQYLLIIKSKVQIMNKKVEDDSKFKYQLNEISELSSSTLDEVRKISYNLRPYELDRLGLTKTLLSTFEKVNESTNITFNVEIDDIDKMLDDEIEINIYRMVQEILNNIIKHSDATEVTGSITYSEKDILISVSDNGIGFNLDRKILDSKEKGFGLKGLSERVKLFGGILKIDSGPGKGTEINICIPFK